MDGKVFKIERQGKLKKKQLKEKLMREAAAANAVATSVAKVKIEPKTYSAKDEKIPNTDILSTPKIIIKQESSTPILDSRYKTDKSNSFGKYNESCDIKKHRKGDETSKLTTSHFSENIFNPKGATREPSIQGKTELAKKDENIQNIDKCIQKKQSTIYDTSSKDATLKPRQVKLEDDSLSKTKNTASISPTASLSKFQSFFVKLPVSNGLSSTPNNNNNSIIFEGDLQNEDQGISNISITTAGTKEGGITNILQPTAYGNDKRVNRDQIIEEENSVIMEEELLLKQGKSRKRQLRQTKEVRNKTIDLDLESSFFQGLNTPCLGSKQFMKGVTTEVDNFNLLNQDNFSKEATEISEIIDGAQYTGASERNNRFSKVNSIEDKRCEPPEKYKASSSTNEDIIDKQELQRSLFGALDNDGEEKEANSNLNPHQILFLEYATADLHEWSTEGFKIIQEYEALIKESIRTRIKMNERFAKAMQILDEHCFGMENHGELLKERTKIMEQYCCKIIDEMS
ncbi:hypothetical protein B5S28_g4226 [[Candida] boidinii]|nr:hypothetical protein B5S28_g4226 [[Candida] boidinii]OWB59355.1 hypothetical protein B5S29_g211 [[Candida] boidinii]OWB72470.1 hypothetical protein B5S31_g2182 [[Candida] boidinii]OWB77525.1 hypothetical protein B5S32_g1693 [[Candida] boidinii]